METTSFSSPSNSAESRLQLARAANAFNPWLARSRHAAVDSHESQPQHASSPSRHLSTRSNAANAPSDDNVNGTPNEIANSRSRSQGAEGEKHGTQVLESTESTGAQAATANVSGRRGGSRFFVRVGSFVSGLYGYGTASRRRSSRKAGEGGEARDGGEAPPSLCPQCHSPLDLATRECPDCDNCHLEYDTTRVPPLPPPTTTSKDSRGPFCYFRPKEGDGSEDLKPWWLGKALDPRGRKMKIWTRFFFVMVGLSLFTDPCYLYTFSFTTNSCLYIQAVFAAVVTGVAVLTYTAYAVQCYLSFRTGYVSQESLILGRGELIMDPRTIAWHHLRNIGGFVLDILVLIPVPQILIFIVTPLLFDSVVQNHWSVARILGFMFVIVMFQYVLKVLHTYLIAVRAQRVNGYVFGTVWWGFVLNFTVFIITAHALGALWYLETVSSAMSCTQTECQGDPSCDFAYLVCPETIARSPPPPIDSDNVAWGGPASNTTEICFTTGNADSWNYGIYNDAVQLLQESFPLEKIMYGIFYGMMTMATFGNALVPAPDLGQAVFSFFFVLVGLLLFTTLIGNIGVFLTNVTARMDDMRMRRKNMDWWMRRRQLPEELQARVRQQERLSFVATRGMDESALLDDLPVSLKRHVKRHLCGQLVRSVPLFRTLEDLVVDSICVRLKPCVLIYGMEIVRQGDPVQEMLFVLKGTILSTHTMASGAQSTCDLGPGSYCGEELLFWSLSKEADQVQLPAANSTLAADSVLELFSLSATDLKFITSHFRSQLREKRLRWLIKYYSPHWRTWAAVTIQLWWRRRQAKRSSSRTNGLETAVF